MLSWNNASRPIFHALPKPLFGNASQVSRPRRVALHFPTLSSASSALAHLRALKKSQFLNLFIDSYILLFLYLLLPFTDIFNHNSHYKLLFCIIATTHVVNFSFFYFSLKLALFFTHVLHFTLCIYIFASLRHFQSLDVVQTKVFFSLSDGARAEE